MKYLVALLLCFGAVSVCNSIDTKEMKLPLVYSQEYNISLGGLEKIHPFDTKKYGKIFNYLQNTFSLEGDFYYEPEIIPDEEILRVHTKEYIESLKSSKTIAEIAETKILESVPPKMLIENVLKPMKLACGGSVKASELAKKYGWAINLSGGYHHAKGNSGSGFCFYSDIAMIANSLWDKQEDMKILIIDLDAHQGNGYQDFFKGAKGIFIFDVYNGEVFPGDTESKKYIDFDYELSPEISEEDYLNIIEKKLPEAIAEAKPEFIIYNAGADIYEKDPLGQMGISMEGIARRDELVFRQALSAGAPIVMLLSGGYHKNSWEATAKSIENIISNVIGLE